MRRKTVKSLMSDKKAVYVMLSSDKVAKVFFAQAEYEGLVLMDGVESSAISGIRYVRLNADGSISRPEYHSFAGALRFYHAKTENGKRVVKIDYERLIC